MTLHEIMKMCDFTKKFMRKYRAELDKSFNPFDAKDILLKQINKLSELEKIIMNIPKELE